MSREVCVEGFPRSTTEDELRHLFSACGTVLSIDMAMTVDGRPIGFATVEMATTEAADRAIQTLHHVKLDGCTLLVFSPRVHTSQHESLSIGERAS